MIISFAVYSLSASVYLISIWWFFWQGNIDVRITFLIHSVWLKMNRTFVRFFLTIFPTLKTYYIVIVWKILDNL